jgi:hypothetical protein
VKCRVRKTWDGANVQGDPVAALTSVHRQLWHLQGGIPESVLQVLINLAGKGFNRNDLWYFSRNQNRQMNYRSKELAIRVLPTTRRLEVLSRVPGIKGVEVRQKFEKILFATLNGRLPLDHDASYIANHLSWKLVPIERHRRFEFPAGPYYKLRYYEHTLGLVIQHDLSEGVNEQEAIEKIPPWILDLLHAFELMAECQRETKKEVGQLREIIIDRLGSSVNANAKTLTDNARDADHSDIQ